MTDDVAARETPPEHPCPFCEGQPMDPDCGVCGGSGTLPDATSVVRRAVAARETLRPDPLTTVLQDTANGLHNFARNAGNQDHDPRHWKECHAAPCVRAAAALRAATPDPAEPGLREAALALADAADTYLDTQRSPEAWANDRSRLWSAAKDVRTALAAEPTCVYCNSPEQAGPCFGGDRCMARSALLDTLGRVTGTSPRRWADLTEAERAELDAHIERREV